VNSPTEHDPDGRACWRSCWPTAPFVGAGRRSSARRPA
jgi:hypothetical protein